MPTFSPMDVPTIMPTDVEGRFTLTSNLTFFDMNAPTEETKLSQLTNAPTEETQLSQFKRTYKDNNCEVIESNLEPDQGTCKATLTDVTLINGSIVFRPFSSN